jgi:hypothetical protein
MNEADRIDTWYGEGGDGYWPVFQHGTLSRRLFREDEPVVESGD